MWLTKAGGQTHTENKFFHHDPWLTARLKLQISVEQRFHMANELGQGKPFGPLKTHIIGVRAARQRHGALVGHHLLKLLIADAASPVTPQFAVQKLPGGEQPAHFGGNGTEDF